MLEDLSTPLLDITNRKLSDPSLQCCVLHSKEECEKEENWGVVVEDLLQNVTDELASIIEEVVNDISIPGFCQEVDGSFPCPIEGFCELFSTDTSNYDITSVDYEAVCSEDAFFFCGPEGFEEMCSKRCGNGAAVDAVVLAEERIGPLDTPICSLCSIAMCCRVDGKSFGECVMATIGIEINDAETATDNPADDTDELVMLPEESSADKSDGETADVAPSSDVVPDTSADISVEDATSSDDPSSDLSESPDNAPNPSPDISADSTTAAGKGVPDDLDPETNPTTEISESTDSDLLNSGSYSRTTVNIVLPAVALLLLNSF